MTLPKPFDKHTTYSGHSGIDFPQAKGTPVPSLGNGTVIFSGWNTNKSSGDSSGPGKAAGNTKSVKYGSSIEVRFCHLDNLGGAQVGDTVSLGSLIGFVGETGQTTGPHLHMEVWVNGSIKTGNSFWDYVSNSKIARLDNGDGMFAVKEAGKSAIYIYNPTNGTFFHINSVAWNSMKAAYKAVNAPLPYDKDTATAKALIATFK